MTLLNSASPTILFGLFMSRFATVSTGWKHKSSKTPEEAEPRNRAVPDSFLLPDEIGGDIVKVVAI